MGKLVLKKKEQAQRHQEQRSQESLEDGGIVVTLTTKISHFCPYPLLGLHCTEVVEVGGPAAVIPGSFLRIFLSIRAIQRDESIPPMSVFGRSFEHT